MNVESKIRKLARSSHWQNIYAMNKDNISVQLFDNNTNLSGIQMRFLYWLSVYHLLYEEVSRLEDDYLTDEVILDDIRTDAYLIYRRKKIENLILKRKQEDRIRDHQSRHPNKHKSGDVKLIDIDLRRES